MRIRTWHNGDLVQDDTTEDLLFPFAQLVADLSQLLTLEEGDIILTGTPAGASVAKPGDVVEIEVTGGDFSSGRLATKVTEGTTPFADFGARPKTDDTQREEAYGSREAAGWRLPGGCRGVLTPELKAKLESVATATLSSQLRKRGLNNVSIDGLQATRPDRKVVGLARTLRYVPNREDLFKTHGGGFNAQKRAIDSVNEGEILVMEARGEKGTGTVGDILALRAQVRGAAAIITDGGVRDYSAVADLEMPTYFANPHPAVLGRRHIPWDTDITIACGGATVQPGDIIVADSDGILVIPPAIAEELVDDCIQQEKEETFIFQMVQEGNSVDGLYPMNKEWQARFEEWQSRQGAQVTETAVGSRSCAESKSQQAYAAVKARIVEGTYTPGYRLVLAKIAEDLGFSVVPVREAIRRLEAEGLVKFERNVGATVSGIDPTEYLVHDADPEHRGGCGHRVVRTADRSPSPLPGPVR